MRFFAAFAAISLVAFASAEQGVVLRSVNTYKEYEFGRQYVAIAYKLSIPGSDFYVSGVESTNMQGMTNDNVQGLHIVHQETRYLPRKVFDWYKNIVHFHVVASGVETLEGEPLDARIRFIHLDDNRIWTVPKEFFSQTRDMELISMERNNIEVLEPEMFRAMPKLRWVSFAGNRIRRLPGTLFRANPALECFSFENNGLTNVGAELVRDLKKLKGVSFDGNVCINIAYWNEPNMVADLTEDITTNCGGRCDTVAQQINSIDRMYDMIEKMEAKKPACSWFKYGWMAKHFGAGSSGSDSNESGENRRYQHHGYQYGPNHACPHAHYPVKSVSN